MTCTDTSSPTVTVLPTETETTPSVTVLPTEVEAGMPGGPSSSGRGVMLIGAGFLLLAMSLGLLVLPRTRGSHGF